MATYWFEVRETIVRSAAVEASSAVAARRLLERAFHDREEGLADMGGDTPIQLGDIDTVGQVTFRNLSLRKMSE